MLVLYINFIDTEVKHSGSNVRPQKIYDAFKEKGYDIKILTGSTSRLKRNTRKRNIKEIQNWLKNVKPDYCYIESPSGNIALKEDRKLIKMIKKYRIKTGYFYRDIYYYFPKFFISYDKGVNVSLIKNLLKYLYHFIQMKGENLFLRKNVDIIFFPSLSMNKYTKFKNVAELPPAGEVLPSINSEVVNRKGVIYVGGLSERYGTEMLLSAFEIINDYKKKDIELKLVCREGETSIISEKYRKKKWLTIIHAQGNELKKYYNESKIAVIPILKCKYNDFAIPIKLFEYMSYNLPIVATDCFEQKKIILSENIGLISKSESTDFANKILELYFNDVKIKEIKKNIEYSLATKNTWRHRIEKIEKELKVGE